MRLRTPFCDRFGIDVPILNVGFGEGAGPELAAAVSDAGGLGVMGFTGGGMPLEEIRRRIERTRSLTARPFGGNVIIASLADAKASEEVRAMTRSRIATAIDARIPVLVLFWGDPAPFVDAAHAAGTKLIVQVGSADEAGHAARSGVDAIIAQGIEAGGHVRATESIWSVLPRAVAAAGAVPVLAAGGMTDGAAIARAFRLGAQGVSLGTRFVASREAYVHDAYRERVVRAGPQDTVLGLIFTVGWPDAPHRALRNVTVQEWERAGCPPIGGRPGEGELIGTRHTPWGDFPMQRYQVGMITPTFEGDIDKAVMWAGESVSGVREILRAREIVSRLAREIDAALSTAV